MVISVASYARAVMPGVHKWFGMGYNDYAEQWKMLFDSAPSDKQFEMDVNTYGLGLMQNRPELAAGHYDTMAQGWTVYYRHSEYFGGWQISRIAIEDNQYEQLTEARAKQGGRSARMTRENIAAIFMSRVFSNSYLHADGVAHCSTANILSKGGTFSNKPSSDMDLSEAALEQACIDIANFVDDASNRIDVRPKRLIVPNSLRYEAARILNNPDRPGTAERDINALNQSGDIPEWMVNNYLIDQDAWFIKTDCPDGLRHFERRALEISAPEVDYDTDVTKTKFTFRDSWGLTDKRGLYGCQGA
jgi:hypothetical protein